MVKYDFIVVGAGLFGIYASLDLNKKGYKVLLIDKEKFISAKLSSVPNGILAYEMFEDLVIKDPTNLVSNYVSPFNINK